MTPTERRWLVSVNSHDEVLGTIDKLEAHQKGILHRAFSIFVFRKVGDVTEVLLHQRAWNKYHSSGLWTNTCCSHAEPDLPVKDTVERRLMEEMGFSCQLHYIGSFLYKEPVGNGLIEHELDHVFAALHDPPVIAPHPEEAIQWKWMPLDALEEDLRRNPHQYTVWLPGALKVAKRFLLPDFQGEGSKITSASTGK